MTGSKRNEPSGMTTFHAYKRLLNYTWRYRQRLIVGILAGALCGGSLFGILSVSSNVIQPFEKNEAQTVKKRATEAKIQIPLAKSSGTIQKLADRLGIPATRPDGSLTWQMVLLTILGFPFFFMGKSLFTYINRYCMRWVGSRVVMDLRNQLFAHLQNQSLAFYGKWDVGELIGRCTNDAAMVESAISGTISDLTRAPMEILAAATFVILFSWRNETFFLPVALFLVMPLCILPIVILGRRVKQFSNRSLQRISNLVSRMHENFTGIRIIKAFFMEEAETKRFEAMNRAYFRQVMKALRAELLMTPMMQFVAALFIAIFLVYCYATGIKLSQIIPLGGAAIFCYAPLKQIARIAPTLQRMSAAAERIFNLLDSQQILPEAENPIPVNDFQDKVCFDQVAFTYSAETEFSIRNMSFTLKKGEIIALVGETGSGKSTIANLLARFYDPTEGEITLDGLALREIEIASLRRLMGIVTQETILFNETIEDNIRYGSPDATIEDVMTAAKQANAHEFIIQEPDGYQRMIGEKGFRLSGGERQRLAIARAILRNPQILILDEATSALDTVTEQLVQNALNNLMQNRTVLAIAHRLSTIRNADRILVLDRGQIIEQGTHDELLALNGRYRELYDMQFSLEPKENS